MHTIETGPVPWGIWKPGQPNGNFQQHSADFPKSWLVAPPDWLPEPSDVPIPTEKADPPWFIRPVAGNRQALGIGLAESPDFSWLILAPSSRQFLDSGSFAPAWVESILQLIQAGKIWSTNSQLAFGVRAPATSTKQLGELLGTYDLATLLGGAQAMVDQARAVVIAQAPRTLPIETVLPFVPHSRRAELSLANWWVTRRLRWDIRVCPENAVEPDSTLWNWESIGDYPVGKYEHALHEAISLGNEQVVSSLLGRASRNAMLRLGLALLVILMLAQFLGAFFGWRPKPILVPGPQKIQQLQGEQK